MNLPGNWTTGESTDEAPNSSMKTTTDNSPRKHEVVNQEFKDKPFWDEKVAAAMRRVRKGLAEGKAPVNSL